MASKPRTRGRDRAPTRERSPASAKEPSGGASAASRAQGSREAILAAATAELAEKGFVGARIEHIAGRAGFNKALVYRHFGDREGLIRAVLERELRHRWEVFAEVPEDVSGALVHWYRQTRDSRLFLQLLMREALDDAGEAVEEASRRVYYRKQVERTREAQRRGLVAPDLDPAALFLALQALISYPAFFPQITRMVTGRDADDPAFRRTWERFLDRLARRLVP